MNWAGEYFKSLGGIFVKLLGPIFFFTWHWLLVELLPSHVAHFAYVKFEDGMRFKYSRGLVKIQRGNLLDSKECTFAISFSGAD